MKQAILALLLAVGLAVALVGYASVSMAGGSNVNGSYVDQSTSSTQP